MLQVTTLLRRPDPHAQGAALGTAPPPGHKGSVPADGLIGEVYNRGLDMTATPPQRKVIPPAAPVETTVDLVGLLQSASVLTTEQAERVRRSQKLNNCTAEQAILQLGFTTDAQIAKSLAQASGLPYVKLNPLDLDLDVVTKGLSAPFARKHGMVAISKTDTTITVAVHNPFAPFPIDDVRRVTGLEVERVVATRGDVEAINKGFYDLKNSLQNAEKQLRSTRVLSVDIGNQEFLSGSSDELDPTAAPVIKALDHILTYAFEQRASDIHFEPKREFTLVRLRIDGILHDVHVIPKIVYLAVVSRIKLLSGANIAEKRRPQDGRLKRESGGKEVELRVSTMPTAFGEKAVLRIFDPDILVKGVDQLGFSAQDMPKFNDFIGRPTGIILVTGPTGSGKTTTLYSALKHLSKPEVNILTIEDPVEMVFEDFNQVAVRPQIELTFSSALRTVLRQDPDIIMVGEIRDTETAENAVQAALTGHLVLSTLHTNDAQLRHHPPPRPRHPPLPDHLHPRGHPRPAPRARELHPLHRGIRAHRRRGGRPAHSPREARAVPLQAGQGLPALPRDGLLGPHRDLRGPGHDREDPPPGHEPGRIPRDLQGRARGGPAHPQGSGHREGLPRHHHRDRGGAGHGQVKDELKGKVFLVTGSGRGLGAELAKAASREGARVVLNCRNDTKRAEALAGELCKSGTEASSLQGRRHRARRRAAAGGGGLEGLRPRGRAREHRGRLRVEGGGRDGTRGMACGHGLEPRLRLPDGAPRPALDARAPLRPHRELRRGGGRAHRRPRQGRGLDARPRPE